MPPPPSSSAVVAAALASSPTFAFPPLPSRAMPTPPSFPPAAPPPPGPDGGDGGGGGGLGIPRRDVLDVPPSPTMTMTAHCGPDVLEGGACGGTEIPTGVEFPVPLMPETTAILNTTTTPNNPTANPQSFKRRKRGGVCNKPGNGRCERCSPCLTTDCGTGTLCLDKTKFGGPGNK